MSDRKRNTVVVKVWLICRIFFEATFGLICMAGIFLLPIPRVFVLGYLGYLGYLGMPRRYHHAPGHLLTYLAVTLGNVLAVAIILVIAALCFRDVFKIVRRLK